MTRFHLFDCKPKNKLEKYFYVVWINCMECH